MTDTQALRDLLVKVEAGEWWGDLPRPDCMHTDLCWKAFNGSLDAAKALHEAVLPGCAWFIESAYRGDAPTAAIEGHGISVDASNDNPARAWLIAILRALIAASVADNEGGV